MAIQKYLRNIQLPHTPSHKGQNGKLMIIGGSELFHAASKWSLDIASKFVDMVFYSSVPTNNELIKEAKGEFWNGIVVGRDELENYVDEADCILIGPGMTRSTETEELTHHLLNTYPHKKWVVDAGALQMVQPKLLSKQMIVTPHQQELQMLLKKTADGHLQFLDGVKHLQYATGKEWEAEKENEYLLNIMVDDVRETSQDLGDATIVIKGVRDLVVSKEKVEIIEGGNSGMTKGGTGDVLAGLIAALYCMNDSFTSAVVGSYINKKAGDSLYQKVGPYFNASELVNEIPSVMWQELQNAQQ